MTFEVYTHCYASLTGILSSMPQISAGHLQHVETNPQCKHQEPARNNGFCQGNQYCEETSLVVVSCMTYIFR